MQGQLRLVACDVTYGPACAVSWLVAAVQSDRSRARRGWWDGMAGNPPGRGWEGRAAGALQQVGTVWARCGHGVGTVWGQSGHGAGTGRLETERLETERLETGREGPFQWSNGGGGQEESTFLWAGGGHASLMLVCLGGGGKRSGRVWFLRGGGRGGSWGVGALLPGVGLRWVWHLFLTGCKQWWCSTFKLWKMFLPVLGLICRYQWG